MSETATTANGRLVRTWDAVDPWATMLLVHGLGEHSGRYEHVGSRLAGEGISVRAFDLHGFGASAGPRAFASSIADYLEEIAEELPQARNGDLPLVLFGHSMGGLLAYRYALARPDGIDALVLSSPALGAAAPAWKKTMARMLARVAPTVSLPNDIRGDQLSRDPAVGEAYFADPLVHTKMTTALGAALLRGIEAVSDAPGPPMPTYVIHGGADEVVPAIFSEPLADRPGVTRRLYPELRHETLNEPEGESVLDELVGWLKDTLGAASG